MTKKKKTIKAPKHRINCKHAGLLRLDEDSKLAKACYKCDALLGNPESDSWACPRIIVAMKNSGMFKGEDILSFEMFKKFRKEMMKNWKNKK